LEMLANLEFTPGSLKYSKIELTWSQSQHCSRIGPSSK
jgi:hypothetical protein